MGELLLTYRTNGGGGGEGSIVGRQWEKHFPCVFWLSERGLLLGLLFSPRALCQTDQQSPLGMNSGHQRVGDSQDSGVSGYPVYLCRKAGGDRVRAQLRAGRCLRTILTRADPRRA